MVAAILSSSAAEIYGVLTRQWHGAPQPCVSAHLISSCVSFSGSRDPFHDELEQGLLESFQQ